MHPLDGLTEFGDGEWMLANESNGFALWQTEWRATDSILSTFCLDVYYRRKKGEDLIFLRSFYAENGLDTLEAFNVWKAIFQDMETGLVL